MWEAKQTTKQVLEFMTIFTSCLLIPTPVLEFHSPMSLLFLTWCMKKVFLRDFIQICRYFSISLCNLLPLIYCTLFTAAKTQGWNLRSNTKKGIKNYFHLNIILTYASLNCTVAINSSHLVLKPQCSTTGGSCCSQTYSLKAAPSLLSILESLWDCCTSLHQQLVVVSIFLGLLGHCFWVFQGPL